MMKRLATAIVLVSILGCLSHRTPLIQTQVGSATQPAVNIAASMPSVTLPEHMINVTLTAPVEQDFGKVGWPIAVGAVVIAIISFWFKSPPWKKSP